jgi:hypothetical protein
MSEPITRPFCQNCETGEYPIDKAISLTTKEGGSTSSSINQDNSTNKQINDWGPWVTVAGILGGLGFGGVIVGAILLPDLAESRAKAEAAMAQSKAEIARQEVRIQEDRIDAILRELKGRGIEIRIHQE